MTFTTDYGHNFMLGVDSPKEGLNSQNVKEAMEGVITNNIFEYKDGKLASIKSARIVTRTVEELIEG